MQRRTLLRRGAALGSIALAGCMANGNDDTGDGATSTQLGGKDTDTPGTDIETPPPSPSGVENRSIETMSTGCASGDTGTASVDFDPDGYRITVEGAIEAANPCHVAALETATYHSDSTTLEIVVVANPDPEAQMCTQCIGAIDYEAAIDLDGGLPGTVTVTHGTGEDATEVVAVARDDR